MNDGPDTAKLRGMVQQAMADVHPDTAGGRDGLIARLWERDWVKVSVTLWTALIFFFGVAVTGSPYTPRLMSNAEAEQLQENQKAIQEIRSSITTMTSSVEAIAKYAKAQQIKDAVNEICRNTTRRAKETDATERQRLLEIITTARNTYHDLTGNNFEASDC